MTASEMHCRRFPLLVLMFVEDFLKFLVVEEDILRLEWFALDVLLNGIGECWIGRVDSARAGL